MNTIINAGTYRGYEIFLDSKGFYLNGLNGLGEPKKIYRNTLSELRGWIDDQIQAWLA